MGDKSAIEWTDATWNPVVGCTVVSAGCDHCYAATLHNRRYLAWKRGTWDKAPAQYHQPFKRVQLMPDRLTQPLKWKEPRRIFVNSLSDLFHEDVPDEYVFQVFDMMALTPRHTFQILTKRPERMQRLLQASEPLPNVWLGVSVEDQAAAESRIPWLLDTPAAVRFLSCEPLLGPVDLNGVDRQPWVNWIIVGGESGPKARPMNPQWVQGLLDYCNDTDAPFFFKQWGEWRHCDEMPNDVYLENINRVPWERGDIGNGYLKLGKKRAGRDFKRRTWDEFPAVTR